MAQAIARSTAIRRLQDLHRDDWDRIYGEERERVGLPRDRERKALEAENLRLRRRITELENEHAI